MNRNKKKENMGRNLKKTLYLIPLLLLLLFVNACGNMSGTSIQDEEVAETAAQDQEARQTEAQVEYTFRNAERLQEHYQKHGIEMGFASALEYEQAASAVVNNPDSLHKLEAEDGDDVYYLEETNEFVIVSQSGYIRTYFQPSSGMDYFNRQ